MPSDIIVCRVIRETEIKILYIKWGYIKVSIEHCEFKTRHRFTEERNRLLFKVYCFHNKL